MPNGIAALLAMTDRLIADLTRLIAHEERDPHWTDPARLRGALHKAIRDRDTYLRLLHDSR